MNTYKYKLFLLFLFFVNMFCLAENKKIVALVQVRNEEILISTCLRALSNYVDAFVILDDFSQDTTISILKSLQKELNIQTILYNDASAWQTKTEHYNRQKLLEAGRAVGGTHFVFIDADEMFVSQCKNNNWLKNKILSLKKGQVLRVPWITLWGDPWHYRVDDTYHPLKSRLVPVAFCDDGVAHYQTNPSGSQSGIIHVSCIPFNLKPAPGVPRDILIKNIAKGLLHYKWANFETVDIKRVWYMCLELIRMNQKSTPNKFAENAQKLNTFYRDREFHGTFPDQRFKVPIERLPKAVYAGYPFVRLRTYKKVNPAKKLEVFGWFKMYGSIYFKDLLIWDVWWTKSAR